MESSDTNRVAVVVTDIQMPFMSMVVFMVKWTLASIPAILILFLFAVILSGVVGGMIGGFTR